MVLGWATPGFVDSKSGALALSTPLIRLLKLLVRLSGAEIDILVNFWDSVHLGNNKAFFMVSDDRMRFVIAVDLID